MAENGLPLINEDYMAQYLSEFSPAFEMIMVDLQTSIKYLWLTVTGISELAQYVGVYNRLTSRSLLE